MANNPDSSEELQQGLSSAKQSASKTVSFGKKAYSGAKKVKNGAKKLLKGIGGIKNKVIICVAAASILIAGSFVALYVTVFDPPDDSYSLIELTGNAKIVADYLKDMGFDDLHIAAILGCYMGESGKDIDPTAHSVDGGYGFAQWTGSRATDLKNLAKKEGKKWSDLSVQLDLFKQEWAAYSGNIHCAQFEKDDNIDDATLDFFAGYEAGGTQPILAIYTIRANYTDAQVDANPNLSNTSCQGFSWMSTNDKGCNHSGYKNAGLNAINYYFQWRKRRDYAATLLNNTSTANFSGKYSNSEIQWPVDHAKVDPSKHYTGFRDRSKGISGWHLGYDLAVPRGTPVYACIDGTFSGTFSGMGTGNEINVWTIIQGRKYNVNYNHLSAITVKNGQTVKKGQLIGYSGTAAGVNHLCFRICDAGWNVGNRNPDHFYTFTAVGLAEPPMDLCNQDGEAACLAMSRIKHLKN